MHPQTPTITAIFTVSSGGKVDLSQSTQNIIYAAGRVSGNQLQQHTVQGGSTLNLVKGTGVTGRGPAAGPQAATAATPSAPTPAPAAPAPVSAAPAPAPAASLVR